jgi:hypothetical protein
MNLFDLKNRKRFKEKAVSLKLQAARRTQQAPMLLHYPFSIIHYQLKAARYEL